MTADAPIITDGSGEFTVNGSALSVDGDKDGIGIDGTNISNLDEGAMLGGNGNYTVNGTPVTLNPLTSVKGAASGATSWAAEDQAAEDAKAAVEELTGGNVDPKTESDLRSALQDAMNNPTLTSFENQTLGGGVTVDEEGNSVSAWNGDMAITLPGVNGELDADFSNNTGRKVISMPGTGDTNLKFNNEGGNAGIIGQNATGEKTMTAGNGGDLLANYSAKAKVTMTGGTGDDTIIARGGDNEEIDLSAGGADLVTATLGGANIKGYDRNSGARFRTKEKTMSALTAKLISGVYALAKNSFDLTGNNSGAVKLQSSSNSLFDIDDNAVGTFVRMETASVNAVSGATVVDSKLIGWGSGVGGAVNASSADEDVILLGNTQNLQNVTATTLTGGSGDDTVYAGAGDRIVMSAGHDAAQIFHNDSAATKSAAVVALGTDTGTAGDMTVTNFYTGHATLQGEKSDKIAVTNRAALTFDFNSSGNIRFKEGNKSLTLANTTNVTVDETSESELLDVTGDVTSVIITENGTDYRAVAVGAGATASVGNKATGYAEYYGQEHDEGDPTGSKVDFSNYEQRLVANLDDTVTSGQAHFYNIDVVEGGKGENVLNGNAKMNTLIAGSGATSIYGGEGRDSMVGYNGDDSLKTGSTTFYYKTGNDLSTISSFSYGTDETSDKLTTDGDAVTNVSLEGNNVVVFAGNEYDDHVILENGKNQIIQANAYGMNVVVEVGDSLTYNADVTQYYGKGEAVNVSVAADAGTASDQIDILTANFNPFGEVNSYYENIKNVDASAFAGKTQLEGQTGINNVLTASQGNSTMWGGFGTGDDTLIGGNGADNYYYTRNSGNDVVNGAGDSDTVTLFDISLDDIDLEKSTVNSTSMTIMLKDDQGSIKVNGTGNYRVTAGDASFTRSEIYNYYNGSSSSSSVSGSAN